ncbi:stress responsive A/B barrel domain-containing protein [Camillea tinctor]|nr:stress responsive A/B barrel domain-containing protein [Camillea tinctor]
MPVRHIVFLTFKPDANPEAVDEAWSRVLGLKDTCIHPQTGKPYIRSLTGGKNISADAGQGGASHIFTAEFDSVADRDFYASVDPAHSAAKAGLAGLVEGAVVGYYEV